MSMPNPVIELAGTPKAGKTSVIRELVRSAEVIGPSLQVVGGGAEGAPIDKSQAVELLYWTVGRLVKEGFGAIFNENQQGLVLMERGFFDRLSWVYCFHKLGMLTAKQNNSLVDLMLDCLDVIGDIRVVVILSSPDEALARATRVTAGISRQRVMNMDFLRSLNAAYEFTIERYAALFTKLELIDERKRAVTLTEKIEHVVKLSDRRL